MFSNKRNIFCCVGPTPSDKFCLVPKREQQICSLNSKRWFQDLRSDIFLMYSHLCFRYTFVIFELLLQLALIHFSCIPTCVFDIFEIFVQLAVIYFWCTPTCVFDIFLIYLIYFAIGCNIFLIYSHLCANMVQPAPAKTWNWLALPKLQYWKRFCQQNHDNF